MLPALGHADNYEPLLRHHPHDHPIVRSANGSRKTVARKFETYSVVSEVALGLGVAPNFNFHL